MLFNLLDMDWFMCFWSFALRVALIHIDIVTHQTHRLSNLDVCRVMLGEAGSIGPLAAVMWGPALCECLMWPKEVVITADLPPASHHCAPSPPPTTNTRGVLNQILLSSRFVYIRSGFGKSTFSYCTDIIVKKCFEILTHPRCIHAWPYFCPNIYASAILSTNVSYACHLFWAPPQAALNNRGYLLPYKVYCLVSSKLRAIASCK